MLRHCYLRNEAVEYAARDRDDKCVESLFMADAVRTIVLIVQLTDGLHGNRRELMESTARALILQLTGDPHRNKRDGKSIHRDAVPKWETA